MFCFESYPSTVLGFGNCVDTNIRADDEMVTVNRGGITMTIPRNLAHHVPPVTVGHLDDEGRSHILNRLSDR